MLDTQYVDGDEHDRLLLYDLLGMRDPTVDLPPLEPDARQRRLGALIICCDYVRCLRVLAVTSPDIANTRKAIATWLIRSVSRGT
jgi:hypothetical protein